MGTVDAQGDVEGYGEDVLSAVKQVDALATRVPVPADTL